MVPELIRETGSSLNVRVSFDGVSNQAKLILVFSLTNNVLLCCVYVDDCLIFAPDRTTLDNFILELKQEFDLTAEDSIEDYLGVPFPSMSATPLSHYLRQV